jgi:hypothetical protein
MERPLCQIEKGLDDAHKLAQLHFARDNKENYASYFT